MTIPDACPGLHAHSGVRTILRDEALQVRFQPIASLTDGDILAFEALTRGPCNSPLESADALFRAADTEGLRAGLELAAIRRALNEVRRRSVPGRCFLNLSGMVLLATARQQGLETFTEWLESAGVPLGKLVFEITEHERIHDVAQLKQITDKLCARGVSFALDDFGDGHSSLRLWAELQPRYVKVDKFFCRDIETESYKSRTLKALCHMSEILGGTLIAEGIEKVQQLETLRDLGISIGQGYFLGRPAPEPHQAVSPPALQAIQRRGVTVPTESVAPGLSTITAERLLICAPAVSPEMHNEQVLEIFQQRPELHALAVVRDRIPQGLINRRDFMERFTRPFQMELLARRPCAMFANTAVRILERSSDIGSMINLLTSEDQRYLSDGFIITERGLYLGLGTGEQLVRTVTEQRLEAARHANPLTFLPGNIPISQHIEKLLRQEHSFHAAYCDLNHFKPYNDHYGYWRGDEMIRLLARILLEGVDSRRDMVGHVGGDDFVIVFQSDDWRNRCEAIIRDFNRRARELFDEPALVQGGIDAEDRNGRRAFFPLTTLSIGVVPAGPDRFRHPEKVASAAAAAKRQAKRLNLGFWSGPVGPTTDPDRRQLEPGTGPA